MLTVGVIGRGGLAEEHARAWGRVAGAQCAGSPCPPDEAASLLARPEVNAIDLCGELAEQVELGSAAARAGKHVLARTPLASNLEALQTLAAACQAAGVRLLPTGSLRNSGLGRTLAAAVTGGAIGRPAVMRFAWLEPLTGEAEAASDEALFIQTAQALDLVQAVFALPLETVYVRRANASTEGVSGSTYAHVIVSLPGEAMAVLELGCGLGQAARFQTMLLMGTAGTATFSQAGDGLLLGPAGTRMATRPSAEELTDEFTHLAACLQSGSDPLVGVAEARQSLAAALAARRSASSGQPENLPGAGNAKAT